MEQLPEEESAQGGPAKRGDGIGAGVGAGEGFDDFDVGFGGGMELGPGCAGTAAERPSLGLCAGLACALHGGSELLAAARASGLEAEGSACLAACDHAPAWRRDNELLIPLDGEQAGAGEEWRAVVQDSESRARTSIRGHVWPERGAAPGKTVFGLAEDPDRRGTALVRARALGRSGVLAELEASGLQGRGGAGFSAAAKWRAVAAQAHKAPYLVLNADEGEPGTFKDRELLLRRPDLVLEGLLIAAWTLGAREIHAYLRAEFCEPRAALEAEVAAAREDGRMPEGLSFTFHAGQGAYICGEETALLEAIEGRRGQPRRKPPYPTEAGLWGRPTLVHNVETIAALPAIMRRGAEWFAGLGRAESGTKLYSLSGHVARAGVYELPLGSTLNELLAAAGGCLGELKAFTPGGASSGFLPAAKADLPLDHASLAAEGTMLGSGGVVVLNQTVDMARAAEIQLAFFATESCGQCTACGLGTSFMHQAVARRRAGESGGRPLLEVVKATREMNVDSICGLSRAAPLPLASALRWWPEEFAEPAGADS